MTAYLRVLGLMIVLISLNVALACSKRRPSNDVSMSTADVTARTTSTFEFRVLRLSFAGDKGPPFEDWSLTLLPNGQAELAVGQCVEHLQFDASVISTLRAALSQADFFGLSRNEYGLAVPDGSMLAIHLETQERIKTVRVHHLSHIRGHSERKEARRLLELWLVARDLVEHPRVFDERDVLREFLSAPRQ